jgi:hypothetical protein
MLVLALAGAVVIAAVAVGIALAVGGGGSSSTSAPQTVAPGCTRQTFPSMSRQHTLKLKPSFKYNSNPPTSGPHYPSPAVWNLYTEPVEQYRLVHNLEHGGVVVQYGSAVSKTDVDAIVAWWRNDPDGVIVAPYPQLGSKVAATAWQHLLTCTKGFDAATFSSFRDDYRYHGPESGAWPPGTLQPGS